MKTFLTYMLESKNEQFNKTVAIVSGSFKFPTIAHWYMVEQYEKKADEVIILISDPKSPKSIRKTVFGTAISAQMAKDIFDIYINKYNLKHKVKAVISPEPSPITAMFKYVDDNLKDVNVIFGVSKKGGDESRFKSATKYYEDNEHIHLIDPMTTAVKPYVDEDGEPISATDAREHLDDPDILKKFFPKKLSDADINKILDILKVNSMKESDNTTHLDDSLKPLDEFECIHIDINDELLKSSKILCYDSSQTIINTDGKEVPVNPKKFPDKAITIVVDKNGTSIQIFFDTNQKCWNSTFNYDNIIGYLTPDQFEQFFNTEFYQNLLAKLNKIWPLSDPFHKALYDGIVEKRIWLVNKPVVEEDADEEQTKKFTASGRKIMNFNDNGVSSKGAKFYCWPNLEKVYNWSTWKDWKKIKPLCRMCFKYKNDHEYTLTLSTIGENYKNRGFRGIDITEQPPVQWLSKVENEDVMKLSLVQKFIRFCIKKIETHLALDPEEIYNKINNPDKITVDEIRNTQNKIRNTLNEIIKKHKTDSFTWS